MDRFIEGLTEAANETAKVFKIQYGQIYSNVRL